MAISRQFVSITPAIDNQSALELVEKCAPSPLDDLNPHQSRPLSQRRFGDWRSPPVRYHDARAHGSVGRLFSHFRSSAPIVAAAVPLNARRTLVKNLIWSVLVCASMSNAAIAQGIVNADVFSIQADTFYLDFNSQLFGNFNQFNLSNTGLDYNNTLTSPFNSAGYSATSQADENAYYVPSNPGISGNFGVHHADGYANATVATSGNWFSEYTLGQPFGQIVFSVAQNTQWSITGNAWGNTLAVGTGISQSEYNVRFQKYLNNNIFLVNQSNQSLNGVGNYNDPLSHGGILAPGAYIYEYRTFSQHGGSIFSPPIPGSATSGYNLTLTLTAVPEPATLLLLLFAATALSPRLRRG